MVLIHKIKVWIYPERSNSWEFDEGVEWDFFLTGAEQGTDTWSTTNTASVNFVTLIAMVMKYYVLWFEEVLSITSYQFFSLLQEIEYMEDPKKTRRKTSNTTIPKLETKLDFEGFFFW